MSSTTTVELHPANVSILQRAGRWNVIPSGSMVTYWSGASLRFTYTGRAVSIRVGPLTERKDRSNGSTPMLACVISGDGHEESITVHDPEPSTLVRLYASESNGTCIIELMMIDWASVFELEAIVTASVPLYLSHSNCSCANILQEQDICPAPPVHAGRILWIGDSISCGYTDGSKPIPLGCLGAFPFLARDALRKERVYPPIEIDMVAFPGISLTDRTEAEDGTDPRNGMITRFFHVCTWLYGSHICALTSARLPLGLIPHSKKRIHNRDSWF